MPENHESHESMPASQLDSRPERNRSTRSSLFFGLVTAALAATVVFWSGWPTPGEGTANASPGEPTGNAQVATGVCDAHRLRALKASDPSVEIEIPAETTAGPVAARQGSDRVASAEPLDLRVLVAEDDEISRFTIARMLESMGCRHQLVGDGQAAVAAVAAAPYDAVLMDLQMPILDGCEATQAIRASGSRIPILLLSASTEAEDLARARAAGVDAHLAKPMSLSGLHRALRGVKPTPAP